MQYNSFNVSSGNTVSSGTSWIKVLLGAAVLLLLGYLVGLIFTSIMENKSPQTEKKYIKE